MLGMIGGFLVKLLGNGILAPILSYLQQKDTSARDIAVAQIGADQQRDQALVQGQIDANHLRAAAQPEFRWLVYLIAVPPALQAAGIYLDSLPFWTPWGAHVVGAWGVPKPPPPYDDWQGKILLSFFVVAPVVQAIRTGAAAVARR